jgi:organic radical activating enzyme
MNPIKFDKLVSISITDVCNLTCSECFSFNNLKLKGHQDWTQQKDLYKQLSKDINFTKLEILGGEPLLHPDLESWVVGIRQLWPNSKLFVTTNGTRLLTTKNLYSLLQNNQVILNISLHGYNNQKITDSIMDFLQHPVNKSTRVADGGATLVKRYLDTNGVQIQLINDRKFVKQNNFIENKFYRNDPKKAHQVCQLKHCHVFYNSKLHKCNLTYAVPNANQQLDLNLDPDAIDLIKQYEPMQADWSYERKKEFLDNIDQAIPQCALCTEQPVVSVYHVATK